MALYLISAAAPAVSIILLDKYRGNLYGFSYCWSLFSPWCRNHFQLLQFLWPEQVLLYIISYVCLSFGVWAYYTVSCTGDYEKKKKRLIYIEPKSCCNSVALLSHAARHSLYSLYTQTYMDAALLSLYVSVLSTF